jgi:hypothetical protein
MARQVDATAGEDVVDSGDEFGHVVGVESCSSLVAHRSPSNVLFLVANLIIFEGADAFLENGGK